MIDRDCRCRLEDGLSTLDVDSGCDTRGAILVTGESGKASMGNIVAGMGVATASGEGSDVF